MAANGCCRIMHPSGGRIGRACGVFYENAGAETRGRFFIEAEGGLQDCEVLAPPVGSNIGETFRQVQAFERVGETMGPEATPSGWIPGKITLKPGPDLARNVWEVWKTEMAVD